jgi:hypothetical protein
MKKAIATLSTVSILGSLVFISPAGSGQLRQGIARLSHTHPEGENYSFFCGDVRGVPGRKYIAKAEGPAVPYPTKRFTMGDSGRKIVRFRIEAPGEHTFILKRARRRGNLESRSYNVPPPPPDGDALGPFQCR